MWDPDLYKRALDFAARAHGAQQVPGTGLPYVVHVAKVAMEVQRACADDRGLEGDLAVTCALLHDTLEDAGVTHAALRDAFGAAVADGVRALSKDPALPKAARMADSLRRLGAQPRSVQAVKLADRITNLEPPPPAWSREKVRAYLAEARAIRDAFRGACAPLEARLEHKITEYEAHAR